LKAFALNLVAVQSKDVDLSRGASSDAMRAATTDVIGLETAGIDSSKATVHLLHHRANRHLHHHRGHALISRHIATGRSGPGIRSRVPSF
jgi:hypothetical protein